MKTILLVEDDPFISNVYTIGFKKEGFNVQVASDGQQALDKIKDHIPDLLTLDIDLPKINGCQVLKTLRSDPKTQNLKVVVLSNYSDADITKKYGVDINSLDIIKHFIKIETPVDEIIKTVKEALQ